MTEIYGPGWGNYAIQGIVETEAPTAVSLVPATPGWWMLAALVAVLLVRAAWARYQSYRAQRYRREALATLRSLQTRYQAGDDSALRELAGLLRMTALAAGGDRRVVSTLRGESWAGYLQTLAPALPPPRVAVLDHLAYRPEIAGGSSEYQDLFSELEAWIAGHEFCHA